MLVRSVKIRWIAALVIVVACDSSYAQWFKSTANVGSTTGSYADGGYTCYRDGIIWAGHTQLLKSTDLGVTWNAVPFSGAGTIYAIDFLDAKLGAVGTSTGLYATTNGGTTWSRVLTTGTWQFTIDRATGDWYHMSSSPYLVRVSTDQGAHWSISYRPADYATAMRSDNRTGVYITQSPSNLRSQVMKTTDHGVSWNPTGGIIDLDSHELIFDSCDRSRMYIMNEDIASSPDGITTIFVSTDAGASFTMFGSSTFGPANPVNYSGGFAESQHVLYAQRLDRISRSTDRGLTWSDVGGPAGHIDAQYVCAITDNIVVAIDSFGNIWRTANAGGDSLSIGDTPQATPAQLFARDTVALCASLVRGFAARSANCGATSIVAVTIQGPDAPEFMLTRSGFGVASDSIELLFTPLHPGSHTATAIVEFSDGTSVSVPLLPISSSSTATILKPVSTIRQDTVGGDVTFELGESFAYPTPQNQSGFRVFLHYDPDQLVFVDAASETAALDPHLAGGALTIDVIPMIERGDVVARLTFHFFPDGTGSRSAWIVGDSLLCSAIAIDSIRPLEALSCAASNDTALVIDVCSKLDCGKSLLSEYLRQEPLLLRIVPNPAESVIEATTSVPLTGTLHIFDITGATRISTTIRGGVARVDVDRLEGGVYAAEVTSEDGVVLSARFIKH